MKLLAIAKEVQLVTSVWLKQTRGSFWVVGPLMAVEGVTTLVLLAWPPAEAPSSLPWIGAVTLALALGTTVLVSAPIHGRLGAGRDLRLLARLVRTNWIRTVAWTAHGGVAIALGLAR